MTNYSVNNLTSLRNLQVAIGETATVIQDKNSLWIKLEDGEYYGWHLLLRDIEPVELV